MTSLVQVATRKTINFDIEALRGFAALFVVWDHANGFKNMLDPNFGSYGIFLYSPSGRFFVLIFFLLSGYVIGVSNKSALTWGTSLAYLKKRLVRLYPIFLITMLFMLVVSPKHFNATTIAGNLAMLQGLCVVDVNPPAWSLHYEMLYYLLFIIFSIFRLNPFIIAIIALAVALINFALYPTLNAPIISSYSYGLIFWVLGLGISRVLANVSDDKSPRQILLSCLLFALCIDQFNLFEKIINKIMLAADTRIAFPKDLYWSQIALEFFNLVYLPFGVIIILVFIGKQIPYRRWLLRGLILFSAINLLSVVKHIYLGDLYEVYVLPTGFMLCSLVCLLVPNAGIEKIGQHVIKAGIWLGSLSYGIYLVHYPLLILFSRIIVFSGTWLTFAMRFALLMLLTVGIGYWLEKVMQPWVKAFFFKDTPVIIPESGQHSKLMH